MKKLSSSFLIISILLAGTFISCKKETSINGNTAPDEVAGARSQGKGKPRPPVANAGPDQIIIPPTNTAALNGSASTDPNSDISSYLWTKISGPSSFTIANANAAQTQVSNLIAGVYKFELKVTDAKGLFDKDTVQVTVMMMNLPPPCTSCKIVFVSARDGNNEIYTCNTDGSNITRLTNDPGNDDDPVWSPDGTRIAFTSDRDGYPGLYIMNADGSNVVRRTFSVHPNGGILGLTWSPDGTKIAYSDYAYFSEYGFVEGAGIYTVSATSGSPLLLFEDGFNPAWSPDGTKIALTVKRDTRFEGYATYNIYTINADGTGFTPLTVGIKSGFNLFDYPSWSPNGGMLAVVFTEESGGSHISVMNSNGSGFTSLMSGVAWAGTSWSADGTAIVYTSWSGSTNNVSWVAADGSAGGTIVTNGWNADWKH